ncbi:Oxidoreductase, aldo/keto reductase family [Lachnospiraceae bacterium TWA4]|nr:Oxidoreductase, aldo/keto reductase family [Lachnospiraceae bacterium TWA4]
MKNVTLLNGRSVPCMGQGTWYLGDNPSTREEEIKALRTGIESGMTLIDTAEMYGNGRSECLVGEAITSYNREDIFLVSKVLPQNAGKQRMRIACENSLKRLGVDTLDLYLYHWRGSIPLRETVEELEKLKELGMIRDWGVSNLDIDDMEELSKYDKKNHCQVNQVLYHMASRGIEYSLLPWMRKQKIALMSYCPLAQAGSLKRGLFTNKTLNEIAKGHDATVAQILLAWNIRGEGTIAIPRTGKMEHTLENAKATTINLSKEELELIDSIYPAPNHKVWLDMQ